MDFHSLTRKELQALSKLNKIPANITNVAMADSLAALEHVEGLEEFLNQSQLDHQQLPNDNTVTDGSPVAPRTSCRTSTRSRKPVTKEVPESSQPLTRTRRTTRLEVAEEKAVDQEPSEVPPKTPAAPTTRRRAPLASATGKTETHKNDVGSVQRAYSTRRSVRLLEQTLEKLCLGEDLKIQPMKIDDLREASSEKIEDESSEIQMELHEEVKEKAGEEEELKSESELKQVIESSDEKMDVMNETLVEEELDCVPVSKRSDESRNLQGKDFGTPQDLENGDSLSVDDSDEVKETAISLKSSPAYALIENLDAQSNKSPAEGPIVLANNGIIQSMTESEASLSNVDVVELQSEVVVENETDEDGPEDEETDEYSTEEDETNVAEAEIIVLRSESVIEKESDEENSEEEEETDEDSSEEEESEALTEECMGSEDDVESDLETSLVDVNVVEAKVVIANDNYSQGKFDLGSEPITSENSPLIDVNVVQEEENKSSHCPVSVTKIGAKTPVKSPFAANQISGQFPRPSLPTPSKSHPVMQIIADALDENEGKTEAKNEEKDVPKLLEDASLRQLQKMLKTKLQIVNEKKAEKKTRIALQENRLAVDERQNDN